MNPGALTVLAKAPEPGRVKTRLARVLGDGPASALHEALALDVLERVSRWAEGSGAFRVLALSGDPLAGERLAAPARGWGFAIERQVEGDLGDRIEASVARRLADGRAWALVVGSDAPVLGDDLLDEAVGALARADVALVAARDGGFVLLAARRLAPGALRGVPWGTGEVLARTRKALESTGHAVLTVGQEEDVDDIESLARLALRPELGACPRTSAWLGAWPHREALCSRAAAGHRVR